jgi:CHAT domain-containing protein/tetratricopeptide (TPR) repeat protein
MIKNIFLSIILLCSSAVGFNQNSKISLKDSLITEKLQREGIRLGRFGDYEAALIKFDSINHIRKKIYGEKSVRLVSPLNNIGIQYKNLQNLDKAIAAFSKSEYLYKEAYGDEYPLLGAVYSNLGIIYGLKGDFNQAIKYHQNAIRLLKKDSIRLNEYLQGTKYNLVETQLRLGYNKEVIQFALTNIESTVPRLKPRLYDLIAQAYRNENKPDLSEKYYLLSIQCWLELYGDLNVELATEYLSYSSLMISERNFEKALTFSSKAKTIALKFYGEKGAVYAEVESNFGDYYYLKNSEAQQIEDFHTQRKRNLKVALQYYQSSIVSLVDSFKTQDPFVDPPLKNVISEIQLVEKLKKKAMAMEKLADIYSSEFDTKNAVSYLTASLNSMNKAIQLIHRLQIGFENEESKFFLARNQESTFSDAVKISFKLYNQTKKSEFLETAFEFSERSKSSNLLASVKDMKAKEFGGIPDSLLIAENTLKGNIANYTSMLFEENHAVRPDSQKVNLYTAKIFKFNEEYNKLIDSFEKLFPRYYSFKYENKVVGIHDIQSKLSKREALIEFYIREPDLDHTEGELFRFVITQDSVSLSMDNFDSTFLKNIQSVRDFLVNPNYLFTKKRDFVDYSISGYSLFEKLIKPVENKLYGKDLTIIPHDKLSYVPFDALLEQMPDTSVMDFRNLKYLVRSYVINYSYSATLLYDFSEKEKNSSKSLLAFSPYFDPKTPYVDPETSAKQFLNPLPGAKDEVKGISRYFKTNSFLDEFAQEYVFKEKANEFDILHLAMHTIINDSLPMFSKLVFSRPDNKSNDDGYLNTYEIYNMKLNARLAVLSACETGTGMLQKGEGVMSMARAFIYAGCPSIVMTLWQVEDKSGVKIMEDFYYYLSKGKRKDVALHMAKLNHLESSDPLTSHPHYWLGYVNIGNPEALKSSTNKYFLLFLILIGLFLAGDWYRRRTHK